MCICNSPTQSAGRRTAQQNAVIGGKGGKGGRGRREKGESLSTQKTDKDGLHGRLEVGGVHAVKVGGHSYAKTFSSSRSGTRALFVPARHRSRSHYR